MSPRQKTHSKLIPTLEDHPKHLPNTAALLKPSASSALEEIHSLHNEIESIARVSREKRIRVGKLLIDLKKKCVHGTWGAFIKENLPFCERTAQNYMGDYTNRAKLKSANVADLNLSKVYLPLAEKPAHTTSPPNEKSKAAACAMENQQDPVAVVEPTTATAEHKADRIKAISRAMLDKLERLPLDKLDQFAADLAAFKADWMRQHCPEMAGNPPAHSGKGGRQ